MAGTDQRLTAQAGVVDTCGQGRTLPRSARNRTWTGAQPWQVLSSVLATAAMQQCDPVALLLPLLRAPGPVLGRPCHPRHRRRGVRPVSATRRARPPVRYRVTVTELVDDTVTVVMDATGTGFHAAVGDLGACPPTRRARHRRTTPPPGAPRPVHRADHPTGPITRPANAIRDA
jgi:hypothetical protein